MLALVFVALRLSWHVLRPVQASQSSVLTLRTFDIGGTGTKTALLSATSVLEFASAEGTLPVAGVSGVEELHWLEEPSQLGPAPGETGYAQWLREAVPQLSAELADETVVFGVSTAGRLDPRTGRIRSWYGGGHPPLWQGRRDEAPRVADIMGLPRGRTFVVHDGTSHLLTCSRRLPPLLPKLATFAVGTGIAFGLTDGSPAALDRSTPQGEAGLSLSGAGLSGAPYIGTWRGWLDAKQDAAAVRKVLTQEFADIEQPWETPWTSLVLASRGLALAAAAFPNHLNEACHTEAEGGIGSDEACRSSSGSSSSGSCSSTGGHLCHGGDRFTRPGPQAIRAFAEQWLHFLWSEFLPQFQGRVEHLCFAGGIIEHNWHALQEFLVDAESGRLRRMPGRDSDTPERVEPIVLPPAPKGSGLVGAGMYALHGFQHGISDFWSQA